MNGVGLQLQNFKNYSDSFTQICNILFYSSFFISAFSQNLYGQYTSAECPVPISEELASSGHFTFGYMTVPEFHKDTGSQAIELAVAVFKCRTGAPVHEPLVLNSGGPGMSNLEDFVPTFDGPLGNLFLNERDIVIIEVRGLKHSRPNLRTPELDRLQVDLLGKNLTAVSLNAVANVQAGFNKMCLTSVVKLEEIFMELNYSPDATCVQDFVKEREYNLPW